MIKEIEREDIRKFMRRATNFGVPIEYDRSQTVRPKFGYGSEELHCLYQKFSFGLEEQNWF